MRRLLGDRPATAMRPAPIHDHILFGRVPLGACAQILDILAAAGAALTRGIQCLMNRTSPGGAGIQPRLDRGASAEWDVFGLASSHDGRDSAPERPTDLGRLRLTQRCAAAGEGDQIARSQDICTKTRLGHWGGHGDGRILRKLRWRMARLSFPDRRVHARPCKPPRRRRTPAEARR